MVTTMREQEIFLLKPDRPDIHRPPNQNQQNGFILVVEDDGPTVRLERVIMEEEGYQVEVANSGEAALELLANNSPSLILLDIGLPGMDGFTTCSKIREISQVPIVMVTGRHCLEDKVKGMDGGADDYVTKPFLTDELATRVKVVLRRANMATEKLNQLGEASQPIPTTDQHQWALEANQPDIESAEDNSTLAPAAAELPVPVLEDVNWQEPTATPTTADPVAAGRNYEGTVRLAITTLGPVRNLINFVSELRQSPKFRLLRLVANQHTEGMDIWLGLRGPMPLVEILTAVQGVHAVVPEDTSAKASMDQLLFVTLD